MRLDPLGILLRDRPARTTAAGAALALALTVIAGGGTAGSAEAAAAAAPAPAATPAPVPAGSPQSAAATGQALPGKTTTSTVTLLTGDRFRVETAEDGTQRVNLLPDARDTAGGTFSQLNLGPDTYVVPSEAVPYLGRTIDMRLFNVSYLVRAKLDDEHSKTLPVKVRATGAKAEGLPATSVSATADGVARAKVTKKDAGRLGRLLARQWRGAGSGATGTLPGVERIELAVPKGAPEPPAVPTGASAKAAASGVRFHRLTVDAIGRDGKPGVMFGAVSNVTDGKLASFPAAFAFPGEGRKSFMVPEGTYSIMAGVFAGPDSDLSTQMALVSKPEVRVSAATTVVLDARGAVPYQVNLETPPQKDLQRLDAFTFVRTSAAGDQTGVAPADLPWGLLWRTISYHMNGNPGISATPTQPVTTGRFDFLGMTSLVEGEVSGPEMGSTYELLFPYGGAVPASMTHTIKASDLTTVHSSLTDEPSDEPSPGPLNRLSYAFLPWGWTDFGYGGNPAAGERTDYLYSSRPDQVIWQSAVGPDRGDRLHGPRRQIRPGQVIREVWNRGPEVPSAAATYVQRPQHGINGTPNTQIDAPMAQVCAACRQGNLGMVYLLPSGDSDPLHFAEPGWQSSKLAFYRDGKPAFGTGVIFDYAPEPESLPLLPRPADYRLTWTTTQEATPDAKGTTEWTFRSGPQDAAANLPKDVQCADPSLPCSFLPLLFVHWDLALDHESRAAAGQPFDVGFRVSSQQHQAAPAGVAATVEVSYDGGETWSEPQAATRKADGTFAAPITHPDYAEAVRWVSLRVKAHDAGGSTVTQTNIRAYRLIGS
ncbi:hypothetical protein [Nonomuraea zeae]|uniref:Uncharacterized protein n=1 Tax=Nonomuraea zeae TaxID=1642303 RepID=A0A5S4F2N4_9ACTN|nr:hypothetical protein [Nonomuraea zeae]TMR10367.1 hypothetical protein ETD85_60540 [Nonomuraea zeae]